MSDYSFPTSINDGSEKFCLIPILEQWRDREFGVMHDSEYFSQKI